MNQVKIDEMIPTTQIIKIILNPLQRIKKAPLIMPDEEKKILSNLMLLESISFTKFNFRLQF